MKDAVLAENAGVCECIYAHNASLTLGVEKMKTAIQDIIV